MFYNRPLQYISNVGTQGQLATPGTSAFPPSCFLSLQIKGLEIPFMPLSLVPVYIEFRALSRSSTHTVFTRTLFGNCSGIDQDSEMLLCAYIYMYVVMKTHGFGLPYNDQHINY